MGGGVSSSLLKDDDAADKEIDLQYNIHQLMKSVEKFVINVYASCPRVEAMWLILSSDLGQKGFMTFVKTEHADEYLILFKDVAEVRSLEHPTKYSLSDSLIRINRTYLDADAEMNITISQALRGEMAQIIKLDLEANENIRAYFLQLLERIQNETVYIMARDQFNRFILSKYYKQWRASESSHAVATTNSEMSRETIKRMQSEHSLEASSPSAKMISTMKRIITPIDMTKKAFSHIDNDELKHIIGRPDSWLAALISAVEALPICFSLATATSLTNRRKKSFPLIYCNKYYEKITGYDRKHILGKSAKDFLQCPESEDESISIMSENMRSMSPSICVITNKFSNGKTFKNLVVLKPIRDEKHAFRYVICIMFDVSKELDGCASKTKLAEDLSTMIPDTIYSDEEAPSNGMFGWF
jgi:PAS domain S-box-containing protein